MRVPSLCAPASWTPIGGTWEFNGECSVENKDKAQGEVITLLEDEYRWSDVDASVTITMASGGGAGLLFRAHNYSYGGVNAKEGYDSACRATPLTLTHRALLNFCAHFTSQTTEGISIMHTSTLPTGW